MDEASSPHCESKRSRGGRDGAVDEPLLCNGLFEFINSMTTLYLLSFVPSATDAR